MFGCHKKQHVISCHFIIYLDKTDAVGGQSLIVAAFDFGTTYSGYAFSFKHSPNEIKTNKSWNAMSGNLISLKTPTSVLLNEDGEFDSFGFDAEDKYVSLAADGKHHGWRLFRRFKMVLHNQKVVHIPTMVLKIQLNECPLF
ncbi:hypothetical protein DPMN_136492 [Dreissena polymorpha]|uniref:Uncharacterized protein n=1 Tax=Dreissena polymorpha TaxID=45954 RepID=A0A9D4G0Y0_DREPO|nr:hypothetical protein DPMN_136492 [Dreissena polymorpha]